MGEKLTILREILHRCDKLAIGFSGGVDSTFLTYIASKELGHNCLAVVVKSVVSFDWELEEALQFVTEHGIKYSLIEADLFQVDNFANNPPDRCYHCKNAVFGAIIKEAHTFGIDTIADGTNADDHTDYRPGLKALEKLQIISPLQDAGLTKAEIRTLSKEFGLPTYAKPSNACLASRIPYGTAITAETLERINEAENYFRGLGYTGFRIRDHGSIVRIEVGEDELARVIDHDRVKIVEFLKSLGYKYITADLEGYRTGSLNVVLDKSTRINKST